MKLAGARGLGDAGSGRRVDGAAQSALVTGSHRRLIAVCSGALFVPLLVPALHRPRVHEGRHGRPAPSVSLPVQPGAAGGRILSLDTGGALGVLPARRGRSRHGAPAPSAALSIPAARPGVQPGGRQQLRRDAGRRRAVAPSARPVERGGVVRRDGLHVQRVQPVQPDAREPHCDLRPRAVGAALQSRPVDGNRSKKPRLGIRRCGPGRRIADAGRQSSVRVADVPRRSAT